MKNSIVFILTQSFFRFFSDIELFLFLFRFYKQETVFRFSANSTKTADWQFWFISRLNFDHDNFRIYLKHK